MPAGIRVTEELFTQLKNELRFSDPLTVAIKNHQSVKTILQIKGATNYADYTAMKKAQHPPVKFKIPERLDIIEDKLDKVLMALQENRLAL